MARDIAKNEVFGDYAAFLHALLPQAQGFMFHDRHMRLFWHDAALDTSLLGDEFHATLRHIVGHGEFPGESARLPLKGCVAYLIRMNSDKGKLLGVLTALVDRDVGAMPHRFCSDLLKPALRSLSRELSLRMHLLDVSRKLTAHDDEHDFLTQLSHFTRASLAGSDGVHDILQLCVDHLSLQGVFLLAPEYQIELYAGASPVAPMQAQLLLESLPERADLNQAGSRRRGNPTEICWPLCDTDKRTIGVMIWNRRAAGTPFSDTALHMGPLVASAIEHILDKNFDKITGMIQWPAFEAALEQAGRNGTTGHCLLYLDLDQLHVANDTCGRVAGDRIMQEFSRILRRVLPNRPVTRITSDSFAALLEGTPLSEARALAEIICEQVAGLGPMREFQNFRPNVSIGAAEIEFDKGSAATLLVPAQVACQAAKDRGRGRVEVYESADLSIVRRMDDLNQVGSIRSAIEGGRLVLFAQPIVRLNGHHEHASYELLVRMLDTTGQLVAPADFMGAAERYQLMQELDRWVISKAIEALTQNDHDPEGQLLHFAVNLSGQSLGNDRFLAFLCEQIQVSGIDPARLCIEITETAAINNLRKAQEFMQQMQALGCQFSLDDFGTGLSSFAYLKLFPVNKIKIDGSFVHDIASNEVSRSMVAAIVDIAKVMHIETVAEYVENEQVLDAVRSLGVDWGQGFHLGEPTRLKDLCRGSILIDKADLADVDTVLLSALPA